MPDLLGVMGEGHAAAGSREQRFTQLFTDCYGAVLAFARRRVDPELAQDVVAETFLTAWRCFDELTGEPLPWLYRVANHAIANQRRGLARRQRLDNRARLMVGEVTTPDHAEAVAESRRLGAAFALLGEGDREVLRLATWEGLGAAAAAAVLGCSPATFKVRLHRARRRLSSLFAGEGQQMDPRPATVPRKEAPR